MPSAPDVAVAVLAAGQSRRFGEADKLAALFRGKPLGLHVTDTLAELPFAHRFIIAGTPAHPCVEGWQAAGFEVIINADSASGMGSSLALAAELARKAEVSALLVALADMPLVPPSHFESLMERARPHTLRASHNGTSATPPALFGMEHFDRLTQAKGDEGARKLIRRADFFDCPSRLLVDIDDPETLASLT